MTAVVVERARQEVAWPTWDVPAAAVRAWLRLHLALAVISDPAPCELDPDGWFVSGQSPQLGEAVAGCGRCPVLHLCRAYAVAAGERDGVWGGTTPAERRAARGHV